MPITPTYPGVYIQEAPSSSHTITAAATNIAVFIGYTHPLKTVAALVNVPTEIFGFADYQRQFGGFVRSAAFAGAADHFGDMAVAVNQFFLNGGSQAFVVSVNNPALTSAAAPTVTLAGMMLAAQEVTDGTFSMSVEVNPGPVVGDLADLKITYGAKNGPNVIETFRQVSLTATDANGNPNPAFITNALANSKLVKVTGGTADTWAGIASPLAMPAVNWPAAFYAATDVTNAMLQDSPLDKLAGFNLMVIPGVSADPTTSGPAILATAIAFCERKMAFLIIDPPRHAAAEDIADALSGASRSHNAGFYFPYLLSPDPLTGSATNPITSLPNEIPPAATVAGIFAATDVARGVWKAPAGFQATTNNVTGVVARGRMTDPRQGTLNPVGINCLRDFPNVPVVVFGARTSAVTYDQQWAYVSVRRMALFLEQTLSTNLKWAVFEPNAEPLWTAITMSINAFMLSLFMQGAFAGAKPSQAFRVQCDGQTTTPDDTAAGIVNIVVSFAPLRPAEFVVVTIAQLAGQASS